MLEARAGVQDTALLLAFFPDEHVIFLEAECVCQDGGKGWKPGDGIVLASFYHELIAFGLPSKYSLP